MTVRKCLHLPKYGHARNLLGQTYPSHPPPPPPISACLEGLSVSDARHQSHWHEFSLRPVHIDLFLNCAHFKKEQGKRSLCRIHARTTPPLKPLPAQFTGDWWHQHSDPQPLQLTSETFAAVDLRQTFSESKHLFAFAENKKKEGFCNR